MNRTGEKEYYFTLQNLTVGYDGTPLIRDITVSLKKGEILTLVGPNGGGKSTILKSIAGQLSVLGGCVTLDGADMAACIRAYKECDYEGPIRIDHVPTMAGEENGDPGYQDYGRIYAIGYLRGLCEAENYPLR